MTRDKQTAKKPADRNSPVQSIARLGSIGSVVQASSSGPENPRSAEQIKRAAAGGISEPGSQLPHLDRIQAAFGEHDVTDVQAHVGGAASEACQGMGAAAYAVGVDVAFGQSPDLFTATHEAAHVVQQRAGVSLSDGVGQQGDSYEQHADAVATRVVQGQPVADLLGPSTGTGGQQVVQRRILGLTPRREDIFGFTTHRAMPIQTHTIERWRELLQSAGGYQIGITLNAIMAKDLGHTVVSSGNEAHREEQAQWLRDDVRSPQPRECVGLVAGMLTTEDIDLVGSWHSDLAQVAGHLLPRFFGRYYQQAVAELTNRMDPPGNDNGTEEDHRRWAIRCRDIAGFLGQAEGAHTQTEALEPHTGYDDMAQDQGRLDRAGISGDDAGRSPTTELQIDAWAGLHSAIAVAIAAAAAAPAGSADVVATCQRLVQNHTHVLAGIYREQRRLEALNAAVFNAVIGIAFAAAGPLFGTISVGGRLIRDVTAYSAIESGLREAAKIGASNMATGAAGASAEDFRSNLAGTLTATLQGERTTAMSHIDADAPNRDDSATAVQAVQTMVETTFTGIFANAPHFDRPARNS